MKVVAINGSPRKGGNTAQCLDVMAQEFAREGIAFEVLQPGANVKPCMACYHCLDNGTLRCVQTGDMVNEIIEKCIAADGIVLASPVYHGGIAGSMKCVLDRLMLAAGCGDNQLHQGGRGIVYAAPVGRHGNLSAAAWHDGRHGNADRYLGLLGRGTRCGPGRGAGRHRGT